MSGRESEFSNQPSNLETTQDRICVLHVDDDPDFVELAATFVERQDERMTVETTTNPTDALDRIRANGVHCVVSDYDMPEQTGIELLEAVRKEFPDLPFLLYTGKGSEEVATEAIHAGVTDYLQKESGTSQYEVLANRIENAVAQHRAQDAVEKTEQQLQSITDDVLDATEVGIFVLAADFEVAWCNEATEEFFGFDRDEVIGQDKRHVIAEELAAVFEDSGRFEEMVLETYDDNTYTEQFECHVLPGDGRSERWLGHLSHPIETGYFAGGRVEIYTDITDRKEREIKLATREATLRGLYEITADESLTIFEQIGALLSVTREAIGTEYATFSHIQGDEYGFEVVDVADDINLVGGTTTDRTEFPICERVFETGKPVALNDVPGEAPELVDQAWGISCYIGAPVLIDGDSYGTFCFYDVEPRAEPFAEWEQTIVEFLGDWLSLKLTDERAPRAEV